MGSVQMGMDESVDSELTKNTTPSTRYHVKQREGSSRVNNGSTYWNSEDVMSFGQNMKIYGDDHTLTKSNTNAERTEAKGHDLIAKLKKVFGDAFEVDENLIAQVDAKDFAPAFERALKSRIGNCNIVYSDEKWFKGIRSTINVPIKVKLEFKYDVFFSELEDILSEQLKKSDNLQTTVDNIVRSVTEMVRLGLRDGTLVDCMTDNFDTLKSRMVSEISALVVEDNRALYHKRIKPITKNDTNNVTQSDTKVMIAYGRADRVEDENSELAMVKNALDFEKTVTNLMRSRNSKDCNILGTFRNGEDDSIRRVKRQRVTKRINASVVGSKNEYENTKRYTVHDFLDVKVALVAARINKHSKPNNVNVILELTNCLCTNGNDVDRKTEADVKHKICESIFIDKLEREMNASAKGVKESAEEVALCKKHPQSLNAYFYGDDASPTDRFPLGEDIFTERFKLSTYEQKLKIVNESCITITKTNRATDLSCRRHTVQRGNTSDYNQYYERLKHGNLIADEGSLLVGMFGSDDEDKKGCAYLCHITEDRAFFHNPWEYDVSNARLKSRFYGRDASKRDGILIFTKGRSRLPSVLPLGMRCETMTAGRFIYDPKSSDEDEDDKRVDSAIEYLVGSLCDKIFANFEIFFEEDTCVKASRMSRLSQHKNMTKGDFSASDGDEAIEVSVGALVSNVDNGTWTFDINIDNNSKTNSHNVDRSDGTSEDKTVVKKIVAMNKKECASVRTMLADKKYDDLILLDLQRMNFKISLEMLDEYENVIKLHFKNYLDNVVVPNRYDGDKNYDPDESVDFKSPSELERYEMRKLESTMTSFFERNVKTMFSFDDIDLNIAFDAIIYHDMLNTT